GQNVGSYFGTRVHGYIIPPETGNYHFWIAGDDEAELWLSTDQLQSNITKIAHTSYWYTGYRQWTKYSSQKSAAIPLVAGERYYFMALHKENTWSDHMSVAWTKPDSTFEMIPASALGSLVPNDMDLDGLPDTLEQAFVDADTTGTLNSIEDFDPDGDLDGDGLTNLYEFLVGLRMDLADTDGDGLSDKWEIENGYLGTHNQGNTGAFGDYDGDRLANHTESIAGSSVSIPDNAASLPNTLTKTGGNAAIHLIGRGSFTVTDSPTESTISE
ncbi:MAG: PA14 domain-containing protein, partial [Opitutales bacterium]